MDLLWASRVRQAREGERLDSVSLCEEEEEEVEEGSRRARHLSSAFGAELAPSFRILARTMPTLVDSTAASFSTHVYTMRSRKIILRAV